MLAFEHHPDKSGGDSAAFLAIHEAYRVLTQRREKTKGGEVAEKSAEEVALERLRQAEAQGNVEEGLSVWAYIASAESFVVEYFSVFPAVMRLVAISDDPRQGFEVIKAAKEKGLLPGEAYAQW